MFRATKKNCLDNSRGERGDVYRWADRTLLVFFTLKQVTFSLFESIDDVKAYYWRLQVNWSSCVCNTYSILLQCVLENVVLTSFVFLLYFVLFYHSCLLIWSPKRTDRCVRVYMCTNACALCSVLCTTNNSNVNHCNANVCKEPFSLCLFVCVFVCICICVWVKTRE